jgi:hypothetical protein
MNIATLASKKKQGVTISLLSYMGESLFSVSGFLEVAVYSAEGQIDSQFFEYESIKACQLEYARAVQLYEAA